MTEKEKKAIIYIQKDLEKAISLELQIVNTDRISVEIILKLIQKQQSELEKKDIEIKRLTKQSREFDKQAQRYFEQGIEMSSQLEKKDKMIDLMALDIYGMQIKCDRYFKDTE